MGDAPNHADRCPLCGFQHAKGSEFWKDLAISEVEFDAEEGVQSEVVESKYGLDGEVCD